jgi:rhodanese-related sulfurtransferase
MSESVEQISPREVQARLAGAEPRPLLLDCREHEELLLCRIPGALHIPMHELPMRLHELDPQRQIIVFCHHGMRSLAVAAFLREQGFSNVLSLHGGIDAWAVEVDPTMPRY